MNKYSLKFSAEQLEIKFQDSTSAKQLIQCKILILIMIFGDFFVMIETFMKEQYIAFGLLSSMFFVYIGFYIILIKCPKLIRYGQVWFIIFSSSLPIGYYFYIWLIDDKLQQKINLTVGIASVIPQFILSQNIFIDAGLYVYGMIMLTIGCTKLVGFSWYLIMPPLFSISWISQKFQNIKLQRIFFSESQTNECLANVLKRICKEKIMIFTYDDTNIKYQEYLLNDECQKYFNNDSLNEILSNIFVTYENMQVSMSSYIHRNLIQKYQEVEFHSEAFQGYFREKKNKINIELYLQTTSKTFFTIKITEIQKKNNFSKTQAKKLLEMQNKVFHQILPKFIDIFSTISSQKTKIKQFYQFMNQKMQILQLYVVCNSNNIEFVIKEFNLVHQISQYFNKVNRKFVLYFRWNVEIDPEQNFQKQKQVMIISDQFLIDMLIKNILMLIKVTINEDNIVTIQIICNEDKFNIIFTYQSLNYMNISDRNYKKLKRSTTKLIKILGIEESLMIKKSLIQLTLVNFTGRSFKN